MAWGRESRHKRGYGTEWDKLRLDILRRDKGLCRCAECKRTGRIRVASQVDHIVPKANGGTDDWDNLCAIHAECHKLKTQRDNGQKSRLEFDAQGNPIWPDE